MVHVTMLYGLGHPVRMENLEDDAPLLTNQSATVAFRWQMGKAHLVYSAETLLFTNSTALLPWSTPVFTLSCPAQVADRGGGIWEALGLLLFSCVGSALRDHPGLTTAEECIYSSDFTPEATSKEHPNQLNDVPDTIILNYLEKSKQWMRRGLSW